MKNILMNTEMTKAILDGRKVQTRRVCKDKEIADTFLKNGGELNKLWVIDKHSKYQIGETIWVREPARVNSLCPLNNIIDFEYLADGQIGTLKDIPNRFMKSKEEQSKTNLLYPKWMEECQGIPNGCIKEMARIFLKITNVRVEKLQDISQENAKAEGVSPMKVFTHPDRGKKSLDLVDYKDNFKVIWNSTAPKGYKWEDNPYVFVYEFKIVNSDGSEL